MKKILLLIIGLLFIVNVHAEENYIKLVNNDDKVAYETNLPNKVFIDHTSMLPGDKFTDIVRITNNSNKQCKLFLKVKLLEQSDSADRLLDSIFMDVYLDSRLIYTGKAKGEDYKSNGINLQNAVEIKTFNSGDTAKLRVDTELSSEFDELDADLSKFKFVIYAQYDDTTEEIIPVPITGKNVIPYWVISIIVCLIGTGMIIFSIKNKGK